MGKHESHDRERGNKSQGEGRHNKSTDDPKRPGSFTVNSPERRARGVGDRQTGSRDDYE